MDLNKVFLRGRLGQDVQLNSTQSGTSVTNLSIATSRKYTDGNDESQEETTWHRVVLWGRLAEVADEYLQKGDQVFIEGRIQKSDWTDDDGNERVSFEIVGTRMDMLGSAKGSGGSKQPNSGGNAPNEDLGEDFDDIDDDLPF